MNINTGIKIGRWIPLFSKEAKNGSCSPRIMWQCQCECGEKRILRSIQLHKNVECRKCNPIIKRKDISGRTFSRWLVIEFAGNLKHGKLSITTWKCRCQCGTIKVITASAVRTTKSCGCSRQFMGKHRHTSKGKKSPTYSSWQAMMSRCRDKSCSGYTHYKKLGITICERWKTFENFLADMGERPDGMTLDRYPNSNGNYEPGNCRWATLLEQGNNRSTNINFIYQGHSYTMAGLARHTGVSKETLRSRLCRSKKKWSIEEAVAMPKYEPSRGPRKNDLTQ